MSGAVSFVADIWLGEWDSFMCPDRATAAEAFTDAMRLVGCATAFQAFQRLGLLGPSGTAYDRWWDMPVTAFNVLRLVDDEIDGGFRGAYGRYVQRCRCGRAVVFVMREDRTGWVHRDDERFDCGAWGESGDAVACPVSTHPDAQEAAA